MPKVKPLFISTHDNPVELCSFEIFWEAVKAGDVIAIEGLNFTDEHLQAQNSEGMNALMLAVVEQQEEMVRWLLLQGSPLEAQAVYDWTALHLAAQRTSYAILRDLLLAGAKGLVHDKAGWSPLHIAVSKGNLAFMQLLILSFPKLVNQADFNGWTPLHLAASGQRVAILQLLVKEGAKLDSLTFQNETPYVLANLNLEQIEVARWLTETHQRQQQLKQFLEHEDFISFLKIQNEQLQSEVVELRAIISHSQATITELEQEASTLQDKVIHRLTLFKTNQTNLMQQDTQPIAEQKSSQYVFNDDTAKSTDPDGRPENIQAPYSPSMLL